MRQSGERKRLIRRRRVPKDGRLQPLQSSQSMTAISDKREDRFKDVQIPETRRRFLPGSSWLPRKLAFKEDPPYSCDIDLRVESNKKQYRPEHQHAATTIQAWLRGEDARELVWGDGGIYENAKALHIERLYRGMCGRRRAKKARHERDTRAATRIQSIWRRYIARKLFQRLLWEHLNYSATSIQRVVRGYWGRILAKHLRKELEERFAQRLQRAVRCHIARRELYKRRKKEEERKSKHHVWQTCLSQIPFQFHIKVGRISDRELQEDWKLYAVTLRDCLLLFAYKDELETMISVLTKLIRVNPQCRIAYEAKAIALLAWGGLPRHRHQHAYYFAEQVMDLLAHSVEPACRPGIPGAEDAAWNIDSIFELFYIAARERVHAYGGFKAQMNLALSLACLSEEPARALKYYAKAYASLQYKSRYRAELLAHHQAWLQKLQTGHEDFWGATPKEIIFPKRPPLDVYSMWRRGDALVIYRPNVTPLIAPFRQVLAIMNRASTASLGSMRSADFEAMMKTEETETLEEDSPNLKVNASNEVSTWTCLAFLKKVKVVNVRMKSQPRLLVPMLERQRFLEIQNAAKDRAAIQIQRIVRGAFGRARWRRYFARRQTITGQEESLVLKRLVLLRERERKRRAATRIQALVRGRQLRIEIALKHLCAIQIQRVIRGRLGRLRFIEYERRQRMGVLVNEEFRGAMSIPVYSPGKADSWGGTQVLLQILRAGFNYLVTGTDLCTSERYKATFTEQHIQRLLVKANQGQSKLEQIRPTQYDRVCKLIRVSLRLCPPIKAVGDLIYKEATLTFVLAGIGAT